MIPMLEGEGEPRHLEELDRQVEGGVPSTPSTPSTPSVLQLAFYFLAA